MDREEVLRIARQLADLGPDTNSNDWEIRDRILYQEIDPKLWVEICEAAQMLAPNDAVVRIWLRLEEINGLRRLPGLWPIDVAESKLDFVYQLIVKLGKDHSRSARLLGLWAYHGAMVYHASGQYADAAECHQEEADLAEDERGRALAVFNQRLEELYAAAVGGAGSLFEPTQRLIQAGSAALSCLDPAESAEDARQQANIYCHSIFHGWLDGMGQTDTFLTYMENLERLPETLKPAFAHALPVIHAILAFWNCEYTEAAALASNFDCAKQIDWHGNALLVKLASWHNAGCPAEDIVAEIGALGTNEHGGHLAKAVILRDLLPQ